jgi:hypothetical protein
MEHAKCALNGGDNRKVEGRLLKECAEVSDDKSKREREKRR